MRTKIRPVQAQAFERRLTDYIVSKGAVDVSTSPHYREWNIPSPYGDVYVHIDDTPAYAFFVFCRFKDMEKALPKFGLRMNPHSGKYNFVSITTRLDASVAEAITHINTFL